MRSNEKELLEEAKAIIDEIILDEVNKRFSAQSAADKTALKTPTGMSPDPEVLKAAIKHLGSLEKDIESWFRVEGGEPEIATIIQKADLLDDNNKLNNRGKRHIRRAISELKNRYDSKLKLLP